MLETPYEWLESVIGRDYQELRESLLHRIAMGWDIGGDRKSYRKHPANSRAKEKEVMFCRKKKTNLNLLAEKKGIIYEPLRENDLEQTIVCIIEAFPKGEPMTKAPGITPDEFYFFAKIYCKKSCKRWIICYSKR